MGLSGTEEQTPVILIRESAPGARHCWRQYFVITDRRCVVVELLPALWEGWNFHRVTVQGDDAWGKQSRDAIVAWKLGNCPDGLTRHAALTDEARAQLVEIARAGSLPSYDTSGSACPDCTNGADDAPVDRVACKTCGGNGTVA